MPTECHEIHLISEDDNQNRHFVVRRAKPTFPLMRQLSFVIFTVLSNLTPPVFFILKWRIVHSYIHFKLDASRLQKVSSSNFFPVATEKNSGGRLSKKSFTPWCTNCKICKITT